MNNPSNHHLLCLYYLLFLILTSGSSGTALSFETRTTQHGKYDGFRRLFVFGDSYADTGNFRKSLGGSWIVPYGITFPGKPSGRFSDGRVLTDYLARSLGLKSPVPYEWRRIGGKRLRNGMNFAYGGSGVFDTLGTVLPNMTTQIDFLQKLINDSVYTESDVRSSVVLVALSGNDYSAFVAKNSSIEGLQDFIPQVVNQLSVNLQRIHEQLGANKIIATSLEPLGCLPRSTATSSYQQCNATLNVLVNYHNQLLRRAVEKLNNSTMMRSPVFSILDLYGSFTTVLGNNNNNNSKFESPLKPCCSGINGTYSCGSVDDKGNKMYQLCGEPKTHFFWDGSHPSEAGWRQVFMSLKTTLKTFLYV